MKWLLFYFALFAQFTGFSQSHSGGFKLGMTNAQTKRQNYEYYQVTKGFLGDAFYQLNKGLFMARTSIGFQQKGFSQELIYVDSNNIVLGEGAIETVKHSYFGLSQVIGIEFGNRLYGFSSIGAKLSYYFTTVAASDEFQLNDGTTIAAYKWNLSYVKPIDVSAVFELGVGYRTELGFRAFLVASYDYGLRKIRHKNVFTKYPWKHNNINVQIGFSRIIDFKIRTSRSTKSSKLN